VRQWHTLDMLLSQLLFCLIWLNPTAWALHRAMRTNLEFLADRHALRDGAPNRRTYHLSLVQLVGPAVERAVPSLLLPFVFPPLKSRILMLNTPAAARLTPSPAPGPECCLRRDPAAT
jgi:beta-lactamase regulating signal transducer with metallopeptidase domain